MESRSLTVQTRLAAPHQATSPFQPDGSWILDIRRGGKLIFGPSARLDRLVGRDFTLDLWLNPRDLADQPVLRVGEVRLLIRGGRFVARGPGVSVVGRNAAAGAWQHVALEVGRNDLVLYVDGEPFTAVSTASSIISTGGGHSAVLGGRHKSSDAPFVGKVDDLRLRAGPVYREGFTPSRQPMDASSAPLAFSFRARDRGATLLHNEGWLARAARLEGRAAVRRGW